MKSGKDFVKKREASCLGLCGKLLKILFKNGDKCRKVDFWTKRDNFFGKNKKSRFSRISDDFQLALRAHSQ